MKSVLKRRYALVGLLAALSVLSSFVLIAAEPPEELGTLLPGNGNSNNHWVYSYPAIEVPAGYEFDKIEFRYHLEDGTDNSVPIKRITMEDGPLMTKLLNIFLWGRYIPQESADTYVVVTFFDGETYLEYMATGPGFAWRKRG